MQNALSDSLLSFRLLKVGGFLIVDDMSIPEVAAAMDVFMEALKLRVELLHNEVGGEAWSACVLRYNVGL